MKHYLNLFRQAVLATAILFVATSCSDEEEKKLLGRHLFHQVSTEQYRHRIS